MITYNSATGDIACGEIRGAGYSGHGDGLNNPDMENVVGVGPIPRGSWRIVEWIVGQYESKGKMVARLAPTGADTFGRSGFLIHGDNQFVNHTASDGCIIQGFTTRDALYKTGDMDLEVV